MSSAAVVIGAYRAECNLGARRCMLCKTSFVHLGDSLYMNRTEIKTKREKRGQHKRAIAIIIIIFIFFSQLFADLNIINNFLSEACRFD